MTRNTSSSKPPLVRVRKVGTVKLAYDDPHSVCLVERLTVGRGEHELRTVQSGEWLLRLEWVDDADGEPGGWWLTVTVWLGWWAAWPWVTVTRLLQVGADLHEAVEQLRRILAAGVSLDWLRAQKAARLKATPPGGPTDWLSDPVTEFTERQALAVDLRLLALIVAVNRLPARLRVVGIALLPHWTGSPRELTAAAHAGGERLR